MSNENKKTVPVGYWNSIVYDGEDQEGLSHEMAIHDLRRTNGQVFVDVTPLSGNLDSGMYVSIEINRLEEESVDSCPCMHVAFDMDNLAFSLFKQGDKYILRFESGVKATPTILPDGTKGLIIE